MTMTTMMKELKNKELLNKSLFSNHKVVKTTFSIQL